MVVLLMVCALVFVHAPPSAHRVVENEEACLDGLHQVVVCTLLAQAPTRLLLLYS